MPRPSEVFARAGARGVEGVSEPEVEAAPGVDAGPVRRVRRRPSDVFAQSAQNEVSTNVEYHECAEETSTPPRVRPSDVFAGVDAASTTTTVEPIQSVEPVESAESRGQVSQAPVDGGNEVEEPGGDVHGHSEHTGGNYTNVETSTYELEKQRRRERDAKAKAAREQGPTTDPNGRIRPTRIIPEDRRKQTRGKRNSADLKRLGRITPSELRALQLIISAGAMTSHEIAVILGVKKPHARVERLARDEYALLTKKQTYNRMTAYVPAKAKRGHKVAGMESWSKGGVNRAEFQHHEGLVYLWHHFHNVKKCALGVPLFENDVVAAAKHGTLPPWLLQERPEYAGLWTPEQMSEWVPPADTLFAGDGQGNGRIEPDMLLLPPDGGTPIAIELQLSPYRRADMYGRMIRAYDAAFARGALSRVIYAVVPSLGTGKSNRIRNGIHQSVREEASRIPVDVIEVGDEMWVPPTVRWERIHGGAFL